LAIPDPTTATFRPFSEKFEKTQLKYLQKKLNKLAKILGQISREKLETEKL
jgi:hypothetical protein